MVSILVLILTALIHIQLLPLQRANVFFPKPETTLTYDNKLRLELSLKNTGKAAAKNIRYEIYQFFEENIENNCDEKRNPIFNEELFNNLSPDDSQKFGSIIFEVPQKKEQFSGILLIKLLYKDTVLFIPQIKNQWFGWEFSIDGQNPEKKEMAEFSALINGKLNKYITCLNKLNLSLLVENKSTKNVFFSNIWNMFF